MANKHISENQSKNNLKIKVKVWSQNAEMFQGDSRLWPAKTVHPIPFKKKIKYAA